MRLPLSLLGNARGAEERWKHEEEPVKLPITDELQYLLGKALDVICLPGHALSNEEWERALILSGRYCEPYLSHRERVAEAERLRAHWFAAIAARKK
jgi:hypothetical protein